MWLGADHPPEDETPPTYQCGRHQYRDDDYPCDECERTDMPIIATASSKDFTPAPAGAHAAVCCDVIDLGMQTSEYQGLKKTKHKIRIMWQLADERTEDGKPFTASRRYTLSLHEKGALRKDLTAWRGRPFTPAELAGFDVETVIGAPCYLSIVHEQKPDGAVYANVQSIMPLPKNMPRPAISADYVRAKDRLAKDDAPQTAQQFGAAIEQVIHDTITDADAIPF